MRYLLLVLSLVLLAGCDADPNGLDTDGSGQVKVPINVENASGQVIVTIPYDQLKSWLEGHKDVHITSICGIDKSGQGSVSAFLIAYEKVGCKKCSGCGQPMPAEKAN
jgi:hypothetical protein